MPRGAVFTFQAAAGRPGGRSLGPPYMGETFTNNAKILRGEIRKLFFEKDLNFFILLKIAR